MELCHISHKTDVTHLLVSMHISIFPKNCCAVTDQKPGIEMGKYRAEWKNQQQLQALNRHEK